LNHKGTKQPSIAPQMSQISAFSSFSAVSQHGIDARSSYTHTQFQNASRFNSEELVANFPTNEKAARQFYLSTCGLALSNK
jgi:hypothetical protein